MIKQVLVMVCSMLVACNSDHKVVPVVIPAIVHAKGIDSANWPAHFGFGRLATAAEIAKQDIDIQVDGKGLPAGVGIVAAGKNIYLTKCAACHGTGDLAADKLPAPALFGKDEKAKTIGNYWPYATTIFDYVRRAMPFNAPGSLSDSEVYHITAYLLYANKIIGEQDRIDAKTLPAVKMPAHDRFVDDDRQGGPAIK